MSSSINFCRTCGSEESESNPLQGIGKFQEIILLFTILNASSLTSNVCEECLLSLKIIEKFADKCATADLFFIDLLKSLEDAKNADLKIEQLDKECLNQYTSDNSSVQDEKNYNTDVLEALTKTRSQRIRQKQIVATTSPLSVVQPKIITCDLCNKHFMKKIGLLKHIKNIHLPETSRNVKNVAKHKIFRVSKELKPVFPCELCNKKFSTLGRLEIHVNSLHKTRDYQKTHSVVIRTYDCAKCQKSFKSASCLKSHLDTHSDTSYICPDCGLKLNTKRTLRQHMLKHSDFKRFKCNICGREYKRTKTFKEHLIIHSNLRPYSCMWCDKTFKSGANFRKHKKEAHPFELAELDASGVRIGVVLPKLESLMQE